MPHECTNCGEIYPDGCESILEGCDVCAGQKFQYVNSQSNKSDPQIHPDQMEDASQRSARTDMVDKDELPRKLDLNQTPENTSQEKESTSDIPTQPIVNAEQDVSQVEDILNNQFEGIKIIEPGEYQINLTKLFEGDSHIITLHEDGKYVVNVSKTFEDA
jgi:predicted  nucleic acid-binding Zn-ribbon protein